MKRSGKKSGKGEMECRVGKERLERDEVDLGKGKGWLGKELQSRKWGKRIWILEKEY